MKLPTDIKRRLSRAATRRGGEQALTVMEIADALGYDHRAVRRRLADTEPLADITAAPDGPTGLGRPRLVYALGDVLAALEAWAEAHRHLAY